MQDDLFFVLSEFLHTPLVINKTHLTLFQSSVKYALVYFTALFDIFLLNTVVLCDIMVFVSEHLFYKITEGCVT